MTSSLDAPRHLACMPDIWASASQLGASHSVSMADILARFGRIDARKILLVRPARRS
jgi:hypothetical protein